MPIVSTVQVTSFVQFDGDQSTAVHTRTVVEISEDGDVLIEDSTEIDNALSAVCVRQSAQVDTESSQMLLHSETQQDKPEFDPKAPPNDVTVEQKSDLVEDDDDTKEAQTNVTIGPHHHERDNRGAETSRCPDADDASDKRRSLTDDSSLTQVSDLEKSFEKLSVDAQGRGYESTADHSTRNNDKNPPTSELEAGGAKPKGRTAANEFDISDVEGIEYDPKKAPDRDGADKEIKDHAVDMIRVSLPKVIDLLGSIRKAPAESPKVSTETRVPLEEHEPHAAVSQFQPTIAAKEAVGSVGSKLLIAADPFEESLSPDSIRRKSLTQIGARPKRSALDLLSEDIPVKHSQKEQQIRTESVSAAKIRTSPGEVRKVSFITKPSAKDSPKATRTARDETRSRLPTQARSHSEEDRFEDSPENVFKTTVEQTAKKAAVRNLRKQFRPSLGVRAKIRRPSARLYPEDEPKLSPLIAKSAKPKSVRVETETSPSASRKMQDKDILRKYSTNNN